MRYVELPLAGGSYADEARPWTSQETINYLVVPAERPGTRSKALMRQVPGMVKFCDTENSPVRGMHNAEGVFLAVVGNTLYQINPNGTSTSRGHIPGVGRVSMEHNQRQSGNQVAIANGISGYVFDTSNNSLVQITDDGFPGALSFVYLDSSILGIEPARRFAFWSDLADATSYNTLNQTEAEASPDKLVGQVVTHAEWWLMGERTIEPFIDNGGNTGTFTRQQGTIIERGLAAPFAVSVLDNTVFWLGNDGIVYRATGYTPTRISTHAIEQAISHSDLTKAFAFIYEDRGHSIFYLTFQDGKTFGFDVSSGEWHRRKSKGLDRWRINDLVNWNGAWYAGDFSNGVIYQLDWDANSENGEEMERSRVPGVLADSGNKIIVNRLDIVIDTGHVSKELVPGSGGSTRWQSALSKQWTNTGNNVTLPFSGTVSGSLLPSVVMAQAQLASLLAPGETIIGVRAQGNLTVSAFTAGSLTSFHWGANIQSQGTVVGSNPITLAETSWDGSGNFSLGASLIAGGTSIGFTVSQLDVKIQSPISPDVLVESFNETYLDLRYSKDGGYNWSDWRKIKMGKTGNFLKKLTISRLGIGREWMFEIRVTDDVKADIIALNAMIEQASS